LGIGNEIRPRSHLTNTRSDGFQGGHWHGVARERRGSLDFEVRGPVAIIVPEYSNRVV
jgi:hypothetical protein